MTLPQSDTAQLTCSRHHFNRALLDWADRKTKTRGTQTYSPLTCHLRRTTAGDIALPMNAVAIDVTCMEVTLRFRLAKIAIYRSSAGIVAFGRQVTGRRTTVSVVWNCFHKCEITE